MLTKELRFSGMSLRFSVPFCRLNVPPCDATSTRISNCLENHLDGFNSKLAPLKEFILPGGTRAAALAHVCRATCRRAERRLVKLAQSEQISPLPQRYLNRLSDLLFVLCRVLNQSAGREDVYWRKSREPAR